MKFEQAKEKFHAAQNMLNRIYDLKREITAITHMRENAGQCLISSGNNSVHSDGVIREQILSIIMGEKVDELKELERNFNDLWKVKRGGN